LKEIALSAIIVNYNTRSEVINCIQSILRNNRSKDFELIIIDNGSTDGSAEAIGSEFSDISLIKNSRNVGFSKAVNQGIQSAQGKYILFLNSDIVVERPIFQEIISYMGNNADIGIMGGKLVYPNRLLQLSAWAYPNLFTEFIQRVFYFRVLGKMRWYRNYKMRALKSKEVDWVTGAFMVVRKEVFEKIGLFDETFFMYYEDTDLCLRARENGWKVLYNPGVYIVHYDAMTRKINPGPIYIEARMSQLYYYKKHCGSLQTKLLRFIVILVTRIKIITSQLRMLFSESRELQEQVRTQRDLLQKMFSFDIPSAHTSDR